MDTQSLSFIGAFSVLMVGAFNHFKKKLPNSTNNIVSKGDLTKVEMSVDLLKSHKYPAKEHNLNVKGHFLTKNKELSSETTAVFISGEEIEPIKYCDITKQFRQNRYFFYLTGCDIPSSSMLFNFKTEKLTLFLPEVDTDSVMWSGLPMSIEEAYRNFDVDEVFYMNELEEKLRDLDGFQIFTTDLDNISSESVRSRVIPSDPDFFYSLDESRLIKDLYEVELLRKACQITDKCHFSVMSSLPIETNEGHIHAEFVYHALRQGSKVQGYDPICCSGPSCGTLHYTKNDESMQGKNSVLIDAGAEWKNYTADVTRCFPINGKWTKEHREIYDIVLEMQTEVMKRIKPGVHWDELHLLAHKILIKCFLKLGIFKSEYSEQDIFDRKVSLCFFPHGLGHLLGLDVHDVGGYPNYDDNNPLLRFLRLRRPLMAGMVVTNEPGCYFNPYLIKEYLELYPERHEVVNEEVMKKYMYIGGVRIEDNILITKDGCENLTRITSDPDEIEKIVIAGINKNSSYVCTV